jgi:hypothetical protein
VPYSTKTILKVMREIKKQGRPFDFMGKTTTAIEQVLSARHVTTPPGAKAWQSDAETSHRLIEDEFYAGEKPVNIRGSSMRTYNSSKKGSPAQCLAAAAPESDPSVLFQKPVRMTFYGDKICLLILAA